GDARDRAGGVVADAGERAQRVEVVGQLAAVALADQPGGAVEVAGAGVVAEPLPRLEHVVERRVGERGERREALDPALVVRDRGLYARLLEHDLRNPDAVR